MFRFFEMPLTKSYVTDDFSSAPNAVKASTVLGTSDEHVFDVPRCRRRKLMPAGNLFSGAKVYIFVVVLNGIFIAAKVNIARNWHTVLNREDLSNDYVR